MLFTRFYLWFIGQDPDIYDNTKSEMCYSAIKGGIVNYSRMQPLVLGEVELE